MIPEKVSVTATLSVIKTGPQHMSAIASVKEVTCYVKAEQKLIGLPSLQGERGPMGPVGNAVWGGITGDINDQTDLGYMAQVDDAPSDNAEYVRKNGAWAVSSGGGGGGGASWGAITGTLSNQTDLQTALDAKADTADLGDLAYDDNVDYSDLTNKPTLGALAAKDTADYTTDITNKPTLGALASQDSIDYTSNYLTNKPTLGTMASVNDAASDSKTYGRKDGAWVEVTGGGSGSTDWGDIGGTLSDQTDLQTALDEKAYVWSLAYPFETSQSYSVGDCVTYDGYLYMFSSAKSAGAWDPNKAIPRSLDYVMNQRLSGKQDTLTFDTTPTTSSTNPVTSGGIYTAIHGRTLHISMASTSSLGTISNASITTTMRVVNIVWGTPANVTSNVTWNTDTAGQLVLSGTLSGATTAEIDLIDFG